MAAAVDAGGGGGLQGAFTQALQGAQQAQQQQLQFQQGLNENKQLFQAQSAKFEMEDAMASKMARLVSAQARALAQ